jgi:hypothetical protein
MMITVFDALRSLSCDVACHVDNEGNITRAVVDGHDNAGVLPTKVEIQAEIARLQDIYDAQVYARSRKSEYPDIGDQLDMIYHAGLGGDEFQEAIKAIKDKYPKE